MKYKEYLKQKEDKNSKKVVVVKNKEDSIFFKLRIILLKIGKKIFTTLKFMIKHLIQFLLWLFDELVNFIMLITQLIYENVPNSKKETFIKRCISIVLVLIIIIGSIFGYLHHKNTKLQNDLLIMSQSIENGIMKDTVSKQDKEKINKVLQNIDVFGDISIKIKLGEVEPSYYGTGIVHYKQGDKIKTETVKTYGIAEFTSSSKSGVRYVKNVTDFIKGIDEEFYNTYFKDVNGPGTTTFTTGWQTAAARDKDKFLKLQFQYIYLYYVNPTLTELHNKYDIDKDNRAIKELVFSSALQYGYEGTLILFKNAGITKNMKYKEVIEKVQQEKINSLNKYTYLDAYGYTDKDRNKIKVEIESETQAFLKL